jgi:hypothetical protein
MRADSLVYSGLLTTTTCWCGIRHAIPSELYDFVKQQHENGSKQRGIYCPLGHTWIFAGEGEADRLRVQVQRERQRVAATRSLLAHEERSHAATRGHLTRTRKRIANGVCPCCHRHFENVERHMRTKHPDYSETST